MPSKVRGNTVVWIQVGRMTRAVLNAVCEVSSITVVWTQVGASKASSISCYACVHFVHGRVFAPKYPSFSSGTHAICEWKISQEI
jgi:hypothetical protein